MSLHIGDRILEVNGTPVKDQPIESIENLIRYSDSVLQVFFDKIIDNFVKKLYVKIIYNFKNIYVYNNYINKYFSIFLVNDRTRSRCSFSKAYFLKYSVHSDNDIES